jgi:hypothetical protein
MPELTAEPSRGRFLAGPVIVITVARWSGWQWTE